LYNQLSIVSSVNHLYDLKHEIVNTLRAGEADLRF